MSDEGRLDLHGAEPVAADVDHVVDASHQPEVAVCVTASAVAGEVAAGDFAPVGLLIPGLIAVDGASHGGPRFAHDEEAAFAVRDRLALFCNYFRHNSEEGSCCRSGLGGNGAGERRNHDGAGFGLPVGVDDGAALLADHAVIPHPGFGIDGLADGAEQAKRGERILFNPGVAPLGEGADRGGRGVEDRHFMGVDDLPEAVVLAASWERPRTSSRLRRSAADRRRRSCGR